MDEDKITIQATLGLIAMKMGNQDIGKRFYETAIKNSEKIKNDYLKNIALINYASQLISNNDPEKSIYINRIKSIPTDTGHKDLDFSRNRLIDSLK